MRSIDHQMMAARFPIHRDLAGFDFEISPVDKVLIKRLADLSFTEDAQNVVLIGGPGTGKRLTPRTQRMRSTTRSSGSLSGLDVL